jgi:hypothetical protein
MERLGGVELEFTGKFCWGPAGGIEDWQVYGQGEGGRTLLPWFAEFRSCCGLLLAFGGQTELIEFVRRVDLGVVDFREDLMISDRRSSYSKGDAMVKVEDDIAMIHERN